MPAYRTGAEVKRALIRERTLAGLARARAEAGSAVGSKLGDKQSAEIAMLSGEDGGRRWRGSIA